ncbi:DUF6932 family protein [Stenotrophomonas rhizophila]|uniref:DUF6932 family protein n=1 Tax=Stenotrophomonas rhizophila TaxID=216778 RepID=UPI0028A86028|nr:hypothetical protein [Stenotrophomonas rhizophila]
MQSVAEFNRAIAESYRLAKKSGFPAFPLGVGRSNPVNATPFLERIDRIWEMGTDPIREQLLRRLASLLDILRAAEVEPLALLVGGSFLRPPVICKDLDCVLFYQCDHDPASLLQGYRCRIGKVGVDVRFVPVDSDPLVVLKSAIYFGTLYTMQKTGDSERAGAVLFDCRKQGRGE